MNTQQLAFISAGSAQQLEVMVAGSMLARMRGLLGRPALRHDQGLLLRSCNLVHTFGMGYPLDLVFMRRDGRVLKVAHSIPPRRASGHLRAHCVLELAAGAAQRSGITPGMRLPLETI
jgi:uncharacterized protein